MNPFPYAGFMAVRLLKNVSVDSAGGPAGILLACYMIGKAVTAMSWGKIADVYGRKFSLLLSLGLCSIFSALFGYSRSWTSVIITRLLLGCCDGINIIVFSMVAEISRDCEDLETRGVGVVVGRQSWGLMVAPAFGGILAEPFRQYPILLKYFPEKSHLYQFLAKMPFVLPNIVGTLLCWSAMILVHLAAEETLPEIQIRSPKDFLCDGANIFATIYQNTANYVRHGTRFFSTSFAENSFVSSRVGINESLARVQESVGRDTSAYNPKDFEVEGSEDQEESLLEDDMRRISELPCDFSAQVLANPHCRKSFAVAIRRESVMNVSTDSKAMSQFTSRRQLLNPMLIGRSYDSMLGGVVDMEEDEPTSSLQYVREHGICRRLMTIYWCGCFFSAAADTVFPLFCMSAKGGLGVDEAHIGALQTLSGTIFNFIQYSSFSYMISKLGFRQTMWTSVWIVSLSFTFFPLALRWNQSASAGSLTTASFTILVALLSITRTLGSSFNATMIFSINRAIEPKNRAALNGFAQIIASVMRALGPFFAGYLVSLCYSLLPARQGALAIWFTLSTICVTCFAILMLLIKIDGEDPF